MNVLQRIFLRIGVLPILMLLAICIFGSISGQFLSQRNLLNVARQASYLAMASLGQFMVLLVAGIDLSVGTITAASSVASALAMIALVPVFPEAIWPAILGGVLFGVLIAIALGAVNGIGVSLLNVQPFMMTLGMTSVGFGLALFATSGMPVMGLPGAFGQALGYGTFFGLPLPICVALTSAMIIALMLGNTGYGRHLYAIGGNARAARLSGISVRRLTFSAYVLGASLCGVAGVMLTARMSSGEANIGATLPLETIAACVIGGVSLNGGTGRVYGVMMGALFITLVQNGMNLARVDSYLQMVVVGLILILAIVADNIRSLMLNAQR
ncbi:MAG: ABC transporter permease [Ancylobacter novellus]|uniref:ABC transporter permease n=1 Tax=Ancylobacter novellus TaxID=921 RepID=A0A2W5T9M7_ANCNO|nr:MAG: ABC transporter permease [Ancylobacter novellus]